MFFKRVKVDEEKEDRISDLPDEIIHRILSFLPSTKQAIQSGILSKRWRNQWIHVSNLIFYTDGKPYEKVLKFDDNTLVLHECPIVKKFHLHFPFYYSYGNHSLPLAERIRFATRKHVEDLNLTMMGFYTLPEFLFDNVSLVKLKFYGCTFQLPGSSKVNWGCLTELNIGYCCLPNQAIEHILSGSPLLESLELSDRREFGKLVIASKSLKKLVLTGFPSKFNDIEISCPKLDKLMLLGCLNVRIVEFLEFSSSLCATIDFYFEEEYRKSMINEIQKIIEDLLQQLQNVKKLRIGRQITEILSTLLVRGYFSPVLKIKCLTLISPDLNEHHSRIANVLRNPPELVKFS